MAAEQQDEFEESRTAFVQEIESNLASSQPEKAVEAFHDMNNLEKVRASGFELIPILGKYVTDEVKKSKPSSFDSAESLLATIAKEFSPQETYLELLEQAEDCDDLRFVTILKMIKVCLERMPNQRGKSMCWSCDTIVRHLCNMEVPKIDEEEEDGCNGKGDSTFREKNQEIFSNINFVYEGIINFFHSFVFELVDGSSEIPKDHLEEYRENTLRCLMKCLGRPLVHMDLCDTQFQEIAGKILNMLCIFVPEPLNFLQHVDTSFGCVETLEEDAVSCDYTNVSLGCYFYLVFQDELRMQTISHVYSTKYLFESSLAMAFDLMGTNEPPLILKALKLLDAVLDRMSSKSVEFNSIRDTVLSKFLEMLTRSMVFNEVKEVRQLSVKLFPKFLGKFTPEGQYMILLNSSELSAHPGFVGYAMTLVKEQVREALDSKNPKSLRFFTGTKLSHLLSRYCRISGLVEADLQSHTDQIISCLNLVRFILIRDKTNETGIADYLCKLEESYLEPVKKACTFARGLYEDYKQGLSNPDHPSKKNRKLEVSLNGLEGPMPDMAPEETIRVMNENLTRVDMIDYLASRVSQCLVDYKQNINLIEDADNNE